MNPLYAGSLVFLTAIAGAGHAQPVASPAPERIGLWNGRAPIGDGKFEDQETWITVHRPAKGNGTAVIICPGGGYGTLVKDAEGHGIAAWLNRHGITGIVLEYRLPAGRHQVPLLDAQRAIRTVRAKAKDWAARSRADRHHRFFGRRPPGDLRGHSLRRRRSSGRRRRGPRKLPARLSDPRLSGRHHG